MTAFDKTTKHKTMTANKIAISSDQRRIIDNIQVNIPFTMLVEKTWQDLFFTLKLNPEIGLDAQALDNFGPPAFREFADRFHQSGRSVTLHGPFLDLSPGSPDPKIRELTAFRFRQLVDAVMIFKPKTVVCHAGYDHDRYSFWKENWLKHTIDTWQWLGREISARGSRLMLENVYEKTPEELLQVLRPLNPEHIGYCLDIGHLAAFSKHPLVPWLAATGQYIGQLHLHDNRGDHDSHMGMGKGTVDFEPLFGHAKKMPSPPVVTLEPHQQEDFLASLAYLEKSDFLSWFSISS